MTNVHHLREPAPPPTLLELVDALATTVEAGTLAARELQADGTVLPLCLALALERGKRLLDRMGVKG